MRINPGNKEPRLATAAEAASVVCSGDWLDYGSKGSSRPVVSPRQFSTRCPQVPPIGLFTYCTTSTAR